MYIMSTVLWFLAAIFTLFIVWWSNIFGSEPQLVSKKESEILDKAHKEAEIDKDMPLLLNDNMKIIIAPLPIDNRVDTLSSFQVNVEQLGIHTFNQLLVYAFEQLQLQFSKKFGKDDKYLQLEYGFFDSSKKKQFLAHPQYITEGRPQPLIVKYNVSDEPVALKYYVIKVNWNQSHDSFKISDEIVSYNENKEKAINSLKSPEIVETKVGNLYIAHINSMEKTK